MPVEIPPPRPVVWPLRPVESAQVETSRLEGRVTVTITDAPLRGVTPRAGQRSCAAGERVRADRVGAGYRTRMSLGEDTLLGRLLLNRVARTRALPPAKLRSWIRHHVEEIGNLEHFLPALHARETR